ncbi:MAG: hypothetical protein U0805_15725 [Pirellulales bacterium]
MSHGDGVQAERVTVAEVRERLRRVRARMAVAQFEYDRARQKHRERELHFEKLHVPYEIWRDVAAQYWEVLAEYSKLIEASHERLKQQRIFGDVEWDNGASRVVPAASVPMRRALVSTLGGGGDTHELRVRGTQDGDSFRRERR